MYIIFSSVDEFRIGQKETILCDIQSIIFFLL